VRYTDDIVEDLLRRDFTINATAIDLRKPDTIIDPYSGRKDLTDRVIRAVGVPDNRFEEDYLRMVRACRFAGYGDGFDIEPNTKDAIRMHASALANHVAAERTRDEIIKMMKTTKPSKCMEAMKETGLLQYVIPPLAECIGVEQNRYHGEDVYEHCIAVCDNLPPDRPILRLVGLLHDCGKPITKEGTGDSCSFYNHEVKGARLAYQFMRDYKFTNSDCEYASLMIRHHMFHFDRSTKRKTIKRWLRKVGGLYQDLLMLRMADRAGNKAKASKALVTSHMMDLMHKIAEIELYKEPMSTADLAISGETLKELGLQPGPLFGKILRRCLEAVLDEPSLNTHDDLVAIAKEIAVE
jgi:poly(A) polymerase/tRNA nucleotidyltransferase (CCA-adding enzyme)